MRVISQDGTIDVPYEQAIIEISPMYPKEIKVTLALGNYQMAKYSSWKKALKAMEMLRQTYLSRMELDGGYDSVNQCYVQPNYWVLPKVFQFPQDDEIEV